MAGRTLELDELLVPIQGDNPCGTNLRWDPIYDEIKAARQEKSNDPFDEVVRTNYALVRDKALDALTHRTKDLMLAAYLTEALVQLHGFSGLQDGLILIRRLLETFWDRLYPPADENDLEPRAAPITWLLSEPDTGSRLPNKVRSIPLIASSNGQVYSWAFWKSRYVPPKGESEDEARYQERKNQADERAKQFEEAISVVPAPHFRDLRGNLDECLNELQQLNRILNERFGDAAPGTSALRQALEECGALVNRILSEKGGSEASAEEVAAANQGEQSEGTATGPIRNRADALRRLNEVAEFFRRTEPHSPISYLVSRAASWGTMPLEKLLGELVKDSTVRDQIADLLGFKDPAQG